MKIVIDIDEDYFRIITKNGASNYTEEVIKNGTILPKGHGRLIDETEADGIIAEGKDGKAYFGTVNKDWEVIDFLKTVPTIIEAESDIKG